MSQRTYPVGTSSVPLIVAINDNGPVSGVTLKARVIVPWSALEFDFNDNSFKAVGTAVTPQVTLTESVTSPGVYFALWNTTSVVADADVIVLYEATGLATFILDDPVSFQTAGTGTTSIVSGFIQAVFDRSNRTLTVVGGVKNAESGLLASTAANLLVKDELDQTLMAATTTSTTGLHRHVFPNVSIAPNRILLVHASFTVGPSTYDTVEPLTVLGTGA